MNLKFLLYSFLCALASFAYFKLLKRWLNVRKEKEFFKFDTNVKAFQDWMIIIGLAIASIVYFFKAII